MKKQTVGEIMKEILLKEKRDHIAYGDLNLLHECFKQCFEKSILKDRIHPENKMKAVLNALDNSPFFIKKYMPVELIDRGSVERRRWVRIFLLRKEEEKRRKSKNEIYK